MTDRTQNIPVELRERVQWVNWRYDTDDKGKETKRPLSPHNGLVCDATEPKNWASFDVAIGNAVNHGVGIGFALSQDDPYVVIDLDNPVGKIAPQRIEQVYATGNNIITDANSYTEVSPSGNGVHIWLKASIPPNGVRSSEDCIELYSTARFMTVTGQPLNGEAKPIAERQELAEVLHRALDRASKPLGEIVEQPCSMSVAEVVGKIATWQNAETFWKLANAPFGTGDDSSIDQGLMNFFVQATRNVELSRQCFNSTPRAQREKWATRADYQDRTIRRAFDKLDNAPTLNLDAFIAQGKEELQALTEAKKIVNSPPEKPPVRNDNGHDSSVGSVGTTTNDNGLISGPGTYKNPGGLLGELMDYFYRSSYVPIPEVSLTGALGLMAGICGRAFNVNDLGLNLYVILLANSGVGKNAAMQAPKALMEMVSQRNSEYGKFIGGRPVSGQALSKMFGTSTSFVSFYDEFGEKFAEMNQPDRYPAAAQLLGPMMELYTASGRKASMPEILHSDRDKSAKGTKSPAFTFVGSSVPQTFYGSMNPRLGDKGLLPRLTVVNYEERVMVNPNHKAKFYRVPEQLLSKLQTLCEIAFRTNGTFPHNPTDVIPDDDAGALWREFEMYCRKTRFDHRSESHIAALWARTAEKALKLAALVGVGHNPYVPRISIANMRWAIDFALHETQDIVAKFKDGQIGEPDNESERIDCIKRAIVRWLRMGDADASKLRPGFQACRATGTIPHSWLLQRCVSAAAFKQYKRGNGDASEGFMKAIQTMISSEILRVDTSNKTAESAAKSYVLVDADSLRSVSD